MARLIVAVIFLLMSIVQAAAQDAPAPTAKVDELIKLLQDPEVQAWLESRKAESAPVAAASPSASPLSEWELSTRNRVDGIFAAFPRIFPEVAAAAARTRADALGHGYAPVFVIFIGLILLGAAAEALFRRYLATRFSSAPLAASFLPVAVFAAAMAIVFFAVAWPPLARIVLLTYLIAFVAYRCLAVVVGLAATNEPISRRIRIFLGALLFAVATATLGPPLGVSPAVSAAIAYCFSALLLLLALEGLWNATASTPVRRMVLSLCLLGIWVLWCLGLKGLFWIGIYVLVLPPVLRSVGRTAEGIVAARSGAKPNDARTVLASRGSRAIIVLLAVGWLAAVWSFGPDTLVNRNPTVAAICFGLLKSVIVILLADFVWHLLRAFIDRKMEETTEDAIGAPAALARASRLRTLLPIFRNVLAVAVLVIACLIVLAQLGVEIGPLIAGAGIFGVALGFGSQTLVKDVISGVFYMFDDAFRVGEYIQAKNYKGTVEGFSLRSVRLRHHRGPVFTVPFGELGAVENMSRDWVIDKFRISVAYNTDINKARKITKTIGADLQADPEIGPLFLQPLKMKGVEEFGDYGIVLSFAMTTVPGQQTFIRRKAYAMIREAFQQNGIEFAQPTVQVGGDDKGGGAAAVTAVRQTQAKHQIEG